MPAQGRAWRASARITTHDQMLTFHGELAFLLRTFFFVLLGTLVDFAGSAQQRAACAPLCFAAILAAREVAVQTGRFAWRAFSPLERELMVWFIPRGLITVVLGIEVLEARGRKLRIPAVAGLRRGPAEQSHPSGRHDPRPQSPHPSRAGNRSNHPSRRHHLALNRFSVHRPNARRSQFKQMTVRVSKVNAPTSQFPFRFSSTTIPFVWSHASQLANWSAAIANATWNSPSPSCGDCIVREAPFLNRSSTWRGPAFIAQPRSPKFLMTGNPKVSS